MFWCFVFCTPYTTSKYTSTLLLLLLKSISFQCCYFFLLRGALSSFFSCCCCCFFYFAFFIIIIIRCYRTFSLTHTHPSCGKKMTRRFFVWFILFFVFLFFFLLLTSLVSVVSFCYSAHHCSQLTIFHLIRLFFPSSSFAQVFCIFTLNIEHLSTF